MVTGGYRGQERAQDMAEHTRLLCLQLSTNRTVQVGS